MEAPEDAVDGFDFEAHARLAVAEYEHVRPIYQQLCQGLQSVVSQALQSTDIKSASIEARAKDLESFRRKAKEPLEEDPTKPKYVRPLEQITDLSGLRIIAFFLHDIAKIESIIRQQFEIVERSDKSDILLENERLGYQSIHYLVKLNSRRLSLPEYARFDGLISEVQIRTILQHAWAEIEHDIQYKSTDTIPVSIKRRFMSLAGLFEIADREFQAIQDDDDRLRQEARESVQSGDLKTVEITPDALKAYLDQKLGPDSRIADWSYSWMARILVNRLGFSNFQEIEECVAGYDDDQVTRAAWGSRLGQLQRFEDMLMASLGERFITRFYIDPQLRSSASSRLDRLKRAGIRESNYILNVPEGT